MKTRAIPATRLSGDHVALWSALQQADPNLHNPFFRPEFTQLAAEVCDNVEVGVIEDGGSCVGFFPFQRDRGDVGRPVATVLSDMHGVIAKPDANWSADEIVRQCGLVAWQFDHLVASQKPFQAHHYCVVDSPFIDLRRGYDAYLAERKQAGCSSLRQVGRKSRKLAREIGPLRFEWHTNNNAAFAKLIEWKRRQLSDKHYDDMFRFDWVSELLDLSRRTQTECFSGVLSALYAGDELVAVHLGLQSGKVLSSWIPTFSADFARFSPGLILHLELAQAAVRRGIEQIDLCRGYNQLKLSLMSGAVPVALGCVDRRPAHRLCRSGWYRLRKIAHTTALGGRALGIYRRVRNHLRSFRATAGSNVL